MLSTLARRLQPFLPASAYRTLWSYAARRSANRWLETQGVFDLALKVAERFDSRVQSGMFQGMKYTRSAILSRHATPMLIGQYERQIHPAVTAAAERAALVIDIGHAEGYYAVGLALRGKRVIAFDVDPHERRICREMAQANGVTGRISIRSWCDGDTLCSLTRAERALVISDIDGGEFALFTPEVIRGLRHCDLIVELHAETPEENQAFVRRFLDTHQVEIIDHPPGPGGAELIAFLGPDAPRMATEYREVQQWMVAIPKNSSLSAANSNVA